MKEARFAKKILTVCMILMNLGLSISVIFLMSHVQNLLNSDAKINLTEIVSQNKDAITSRLMLNVNSLDIISNKITESLKISGISERLDVLEFIDEYSRKNNDDVLFLANNDGYVLLSGDRAIDISGRNYFRLAMSGISNISDKLISRINGENIFVISVPLRLDKEIIGTIQKVYTQNELYDLCSLSLFSSQGYIYVINSDGYIILHSSHQGCQIKSDNYFRDLYASGNQQASEQIKIDVQNNRSGFIETQTEDEKVFSAYTPIDKIHDWFLITSVPTSAVTPNGKTVINLFYVILSVIVLIFTSSLTYFLLYKNRQSANLRKIAFVDTVTGGKTYTKFIVDVKKTFEKDSENNFYIMKFDIDNFKYINKFYGFELGDQVLRQIDSSICSRLQPGEIIARISSDHFVVLLKNADEKRIDILLSSIENKYAVVYFSAGIYTVTNKNESINIMVDKASTVAQSIKGIMNRKFAFYSEKFEQLAVHNEYLKRAVRQAIENDEFVPYYQPKVNVLNGELTGCEALVRWKNKEGGCIYPSDFIPMCEQTGVVVEIDMIIYEKVLKFLKSFLDQNIQCVPISVNFSRLHLLDGAFLDKIIKLQKYYDVPSCLIEIELTESAIFDNLDNIASFTEKMHTSGFLIAMDDFGSGYSSLNMLKNVPIDILKIDKAFLSESIDNDRRDIIFSSIAEMARKLNIKVVVEGVEQRKDVELMKKCGCFVAQGYYFAKPMDAVYFEKIFREGKIC